MNPLPSPPPEYREREKKSALTVWCVLSIIGQIHAVDGNIVGMPDHRNSYRCDLSRLIHWIAAMCLLVGGTAHAQQLKLVQRAPDPHGSPRPARDATNVPLQTSVYFEIELPAGTKTGKSIAQSIAVS